MRGLPGATYARCHEGEQGMEMIGHDDECVEDEAWEATRRGSQMSRTVSPMFVRTIPVEAAEERMHRSECVEMVTKERPAME